MKKYLILVVFFAFAGCFASMPDSIRDNLLINKTQEDGIRLAKIEQDIISINREKQDVEKGQKVTAQKIAVVKASIAIVESQLDLCKEKEKLYSLTNELKKIEQVKKEAIALETNKRLANLNLKYVIAFKNDENALLEVKTAELAIKVAELNFEKAKIARAYQDKMNPSKPADKKDNDGKDAAVDADKIDVAKYEKYYKEQLSESDRKKTERLKTADILKQAEKELKDAGFTGEL